MRTIFLFFGLLLLKPSFADEVEVICHCVNDCVRSEKCDLAYEKYLELRESGSQHIPKEENLFIKNHELVLLEVVDWGTNQCASVFGKNESKFYRYDFEVKGDRVGKSQLIEVNSMPTTTERMESKSEALCLFKL
jgi:hypothetical protein